MDMDWMCEKYSVDNEPILDSTDSGIFTSSWMVVYPSIYGKYRLSHPYQRSHSLHSYLAILYLAEVSEWDIEDKLSDALIADHSRFISRFHDLYSITTKHIQFLWGLLLFVCLDIVFWMRLLWRITGWLFYPILYIFITTDRNIAFIGIEHY